MKFRTGCFRIRRFLALAAITVASIFASCDIAAALPDERQYKVEAAYLYSFFNYITWPGYSSPQALERPVICMLDNDPILPYLDYIRNKIGKERNLVLRSLGRDRNARGCHVLFIRHRMMFSDSADLPDETLTVFKPDDPLDRGGMIELWEEGERIGLKINHEHLEKSGFSVSSRLLELAQRVN